MEMNVTIGGTSNIVRRIIAPMRRIKPKIAPMISGAKPRDSDKPSRASPKGPAWNTPVGRRANVRLRLTVGLSNHGE